MRRFVSGSIRRDQAEIKRENVREGIAAVQEQGKWHGRLPFGFDVGSEGYFVPNNVVERAVVVLDELDNGASKRELARLLGISRSTVQKVEENRERYTSEQQSQSL